MEAETFDGESEQIEDDESLPTPSFGDRNALCLVFWRVRDKSKIRICSSREMGF